MPVLDFQFARSVVHLCPTCIFRLQNLTIANERRGNGAAVDFFVGVRGSVLLLENSYRFRLACTTTGVSARCLCLCVYEHQGYVYARCPMLSQP